MGNTGNTRNNSMHMVSKEMQQEIRNELRKALGVSLVFVCHKSNHPEDDFNYLVMAYNKTTKKYVVICYNAQTSGLYWGHYDMTFKDAMACMADAVWYV